MTKSKRKENIEMFDEAIGIYLTKIASTESPEQREQLENELQTLVTARTTYSKDGDTNRTALLMHILQYGTVVGLTIGITKFEKTDVITTKAFQFIPKLMGRA